MLSRVIVAAVKSTTNAGCGKAAKKCGVCRDVAKSFHFGGLACDSCKAFFRRSVQNEAFRTFRCAFRSNCDITVTSRKCCQYCRFQKCLLIGMEIGWVMTEEERMHMLRSRMEKKQRQSGGGRIPTRRNASANSVAAGDGQPAKRRKISPTGQNLDIPCSGMQDQREGNCQIHWKEETKMETPVVPEDIQWLSSPVDVASEEIQQLSRLFGFWFKSREQKYCDSLREGKESGGVAKNGDDGKPKWLLVLLFMVAIQKLVKFARGVRHFSAISPKDQMNLLRANVFEMYLAVHFHERGACLYPLCRTERVTDERASVATETCPFLTSIDEGSLYGSHFFTLIEDTPTLVLFLMVILFCPDSASSDLLAASAVESCRMHFCRLLNVHLTARWGAEKCAVVFPKLLLLLPTLREIRDKHLFYHFDIGCRDFDVAYNSL